MNIPSEAAAAVDIENALDGKLRRVKVIDPIKDSADFVFESGPSTGKTVNFMFTGTDPYKVADMNEYFSQNYTKITESIVEHLGKADIIPLDLRNLAMRNQNLIRYFVRTLPDTERSRILFIVDQ